MDDQTITGLRAALAVSPDNVALRLVLARAEYERGDAAAALRTVQALRAEQVTDPELRRLVVRIALDAAEPALALVHASDAQASDLVLRARALLASNRFDEAASAYREAVRRDPVVEDLDLAKAIDQSAKAAGAPDGARVVRLRVVSNDTPDGEVVERMIKDNQPRVTFADVGGLDDVKTEIRRRIITPFQKPSLFQRFRKKAGGGILMYGPPGCGKTMLARATAGECGAQFLNIAITDVLDMWIGESERKLRALFDRARGKPPAVMFFDELEALGGRRQYRHPGEGAKLVSHFLSELDGFAQNNQGVLVLAATNVPWAIDPAFRRPGRFDRVLFVPPPDREARRAILQGLLADRPSAGDLRIDALAAATSGHSGADLANLVETAADLAIEATLRDGAEAPITGDLLRQAVKNVKPTIQEWLTTARNHARYANEAGQYDDVLAFLDKHEKR
jgi:SpoVK/Ycf46/Vps4 family AAA+-type ATPase